MTRKPPDKLTAQEIADYLRGHTDFFLHHPEIIADMQFQSENKGNVVSLTEKQVEILRQRNNEMQLRINDNLERIRSNELLFDKTRHLTLDLIEAPSLNEIVTILRNNMKLNFNCNTSSLILFCESEDEIDARTVPIEDAKKAISPLLNSPAPVCGMLRDEELEFLFPGNEEVASAAIANLVHKHQIIGIFALGSYDPEYFRSGMGTLFLGYVADVLSRILPRYLVLS